MMPAPIAATSVSIFVFSTVAFSTSDSTRSGSNTNVMDGSISPNSDSCTMSMSFFSGGPNSVRCCASVHASKRWISPSLDAFRPDGVMPSSTISGMPVTDDICSCDCAWSLSRPPSGVETFLKSSVFLSTIIKPWLSRAWLNRRARSSICFAPPLFRTVDRFVTRTDTLKLWMASLTDWRVRSQLSM